MNVRDSRVHNYPPRLNAAPSQELLVIRRNITATGVCSSQLRFGTQDPILTGSWPTSKTIGIAWPWQTISCAVAWL